MHKETAPLTSKLHNTAFKNKGKLFDNKSIEVFLSL